MSTSEIHEQGFSVTTEIEASPETLYNAWTVREDVNGWLATESEVDARVGGKYVLKWPMPEGEMSARGEFLELVPGEKIVQTWESWGPEGRSEDGDATITVEFRDLGDGSTSMTQTETGPAYTSREHVEMSLGGTIEAHKGLNAFIAAKAT